MSKKYTVNFDIRYYNGTLEVEAESEDAAALVAENMRLTDLIAATCDVAVDIESVEEAETE